MSVAVEQYSKEYWSEMIKYYKQNKPKKFFLQYMTEMMYDLFINEMADGGGGGDDTYPNNTPGSNYKDTHKDTTPGSSNYDYTHEEKDDVLKEGTAINEPIIFIPDDKPVSKNNKQQPFEESQLVEEEDKEYWSDSETVIENDDTAVQKYKKNLFHTNTSDDQSDEEVNDNLPDNTEIVENII